MGVRNSTLERAGSIRQRPCGDALGIGGMGEGVGAHWCLLDSCSVGQLPCPRVLGERLTDLVVVGRVRDVDLDGAVDQDGAYLVAQPGFGERVARGLLGGPAA